MAQRKRVAPPRYDAAFRAGAVQMVVEQGRVRKEVAAELGICDDTLKNWLKATGIHPAAAEANNRDARRIKELEAQLKDARKQITEKDEVIDVLKKSVGIFSSR